MTLPFHWLADPLDPLPQIVHEHPFFGEGNGLKVFSQKAALLHWQRILQQDGPTSVILRRPRGDDATEWADQNAMLLHLLASADRELQFFALSEAAAHTLGAHLDAPVSVLPAMECLYWGARRLTLTQEPDGLAVRDASGKSRPARQYNLARLRHVSGLEHDDEDDDLADLVRFANGVDLSEGAAPTKPPVIVIVVPNGTGLGHVTRMIAVARHLRDDHGARIVFWCFSRAAGIIARFGFETVLRQTARATGADPDDWQSWETADFASVLSQLEPYLVVQDSSDLDAFVVNAMAQAGTGAARLALVRRGMWQQHNLGKGALAAEDLADLVIEPGDLAAAADRGITRGRDKSSSGFAHMAVSAPVTLTRPDEMLDARRARKALDLRRGRHCLVSLGSDVLGDWTLLARHLTQAARAARIRLVWARSPLAAPDPRLDQDAQITTRSLYPVAPYLAAFDGVVSAAGYNSYHELMQLYGRPVLFVASQRSNLDDQMARADYAAAQGWAASLPRGETEYAAVAAFMDEVKASRRVDSRPKWRDGAADMARHWTHLIEVGG